MIRYMRTPLYTSKGVDRLSPPCIACGFINIIRIDIPTASPQHAFAEKKTLNLFCVACVVMSAHLRADVALEFALVLNPFWC